MDRYAIFVDAGYLISGGGSLCFNEHRRNRLTVDYKGLAKHVESLSEGSELEHLRTYWYDGAKNAVPTADHLSIARLAGVKLRLGRMVSQRQKGVDSLIVRDLITLAHSRSIVTGYLVGGDEDLREGLRAAQDLGVRMVVVGIESAGMSGALFQEADEVRKFQRTELQTFFELLPQEEEPEEAAEGAPDTAQEVGLDLVEVGREFGREWIASLTPEERTTIAQSLPSLPGGVDAQLLSRGLERVGRSLTLDERRSLRSGLRETIRND